MNWDPWLSRCDELLAQRKLRDLLRERQIVHPLDSTHLLIDKIPYVNFASNDYLGLSHHPRVLAAMRNASSAGSGAAGLITGHRDVHAACEDKLAQWKSMQASVLLPSGYQANLAAIQTLAAIGESYPGGVRFLVDKLAHASILDAVGATDSPMRIYPHNGLQKLQRLLSDADPHQLQVVLTESIFSMDGDAADLVEIARLKQVYPFVLVLDEAHGSGVYGTAGAGLAAEKGLQSAVDVSIVTLSKAIGCSGGAVCGPKRFCDAILNFGRAYIYSTSISPVTVACVSAAMDVMREEPQRQRRVRELARRVRAALADAGAKAAAAQTAPVDSPIIPIVIGKESAALAAAKKLKDSGLLVVAVRPPTVAPGSSRLRVTISSDHTDDEIDRLIKCLSEFVESADG